MRDLTLFYFIPVGLFLGFIGFILTLIAFFLNRLLHRHRPHWKSKWVWVLILDAPGELLEGTGLILILISLSNTFILRYGSGIESQVLLTLLVAFVPFLLSVLVVLFFNRWLRKLILGKPLVVAESGAPESDAPESGNLESGTIEKGSKETVRDNP